MIKSSLLVAILSTTALSLASCGVQATGDTAAEARSTPSPSAQSGEPFTIATRGTFDEPWAATFVPGTSYLVVTEKAGRIKLVGADGTIMAVRGAPEVDYGGQGGLGDVAFGPPASDLDGPGGASPIFLSWIEAGADGTRGAVVGRGMLVIDEMDGDHEIQNLNVIWRQAPKVAGRGHFSHRIAFAPDGKTMFVASGERQKMDPAQDTSNNLGSIVRLNLDGTPAAGNPLAGQPGKAPDVWTWGHRNILGLKFDAAGRLWGLEHGPAGGDELNLVRKGANYGWPIVSEGDHYDGRKIPPHSTRPEFAVPAIAWNPVIAPGDFVFYSGKLWPQWKGQAVIAAMDPTGLVRVAIDGERGREVARHAMDKRIREIVEGPDGALWLLEDGKSGRLLELRPR